MGAGEYGLALLFVRLQKNMNALTHDQKLAMLVVPFVLFGILGVSYASAHDLELTEEQQRALEVAKDLREQGDFEGARETLQEAGVFRGFGHRGILHDEDTESTRALVRSAIDANDYAAFVAATKDAPFSDTVTPEMFAVLVEAHTLHESGDHDGARSLIESSGYTTLMGPFGGHRHHLR